MEISITGPGELVLRLIDRRGRPLMEERLVVDGSSRVSATRLLDLRLRTATGEVAVAPVLVGAGSPGQRVRFDGETPARYTRRRCREIGCDTKIAARAASGETAAPEWAQRSVLATGDATMKRLLLSRGKG